MFVELALSSIDVDIRYFGFNSFLSFFFFHFASVIIKHTNMF